MSQFCTQCGTENVNDAKFCKSCGHSLAEQKVPSSSEPSVVQPEPTHEQDVSVNAESKKENEKYGKLGGWLIVLAIFLVSSSLFGFLRIERFFENEHLDTLKFLYQNGMDDKATILKLIAYMSFACYGLLLAFVISFFRKHASTKNLAIINFSSNIIALPIMVYLLIKVDLPTTNISMVIVGGIISVLFAIAWIRYFMVSERVRKTFINGSDEDNNPIAIAGISLGVILLASGLYVNQSAKDILMAGQTIVPTVQTTSEDEPTADAVAVDAAAVDTVAAAVEPAKQEESKNTSEDVWIDKSTGLMWQDRKDKQSTYRSQHEAISYCKELNYGGYSDWRLPDFSTLEALENKRSEFKHPLKDWYWSSSSIEDNTDEVCSWEATLAICGTDGGSASNPYGWWNPNPVRCVR